MLTTFSDGYRAALASLRWGPQAPPGKLTEFAIRWIEVTNWPSSLPERLIFNRLARMVERANRAAESRTPVYSWFGPSQPSPIS
jgi:hypothetical protein